MGEAKISPEQSLDISSVPEDSIYEPLPVSESAQAGRGGRSPKSKLAMKVRPTRRPPPPFPHPPLTLAVAPAPAHPITDIENNGEIGCGQADPRYSASH